MADPTPPDPRPLSPDEEAPIREVLSQFERLRFAPDCVLLLAGLLLKDGGDYKDAVDRAFKLREVFEQKLLEKGAQQFGAKVEVFNKDTELFGYAFLPIKDWSDGLKYITGQERADRAEEYFFRFFDNLVTSKRTTRDLFRIGVFLSGLKSGETVLFSRGLEYWQRKGFSKTELAELKKDYDDWWPSRGSKK
jgi:hypothetical protein